MELCSVQSLYLRQSSNPVDSISDMEFAVDAFLNGCAVDIEELIDSRCFSLAPATPDHAAKNWKNLIALCLMGGGTHAPLLSQKVAHLLQQPWDQNSQYQRVLVALTQSLVGMTPLDAAPTLLPSGAAAFPQREYSPWLDLPYFPLHAEFAFFLCLLAHRSDRQDWKSAAALAAVWQLNALDLNFYPVVGLFTQEKQGAITNHLLWNYLLFKGMSCLLKEHSFEESARAQLKYLEAMQPQAMGRISALMPLLERQIPTHNSIDGRMTLQEKIHDPHTALVGFRTSQHHAICTLHGGFTGMGSYRHQDVWITSYGPQYLPLGECQGFGIEGNSLTDHHARKSEIECGAATFSLRGCARLVDQPIQGQSEFGQFRGIWLETEQEYHEQKLHIRTHLLGFTSWEGVAFSFFVKANRCRLKDGNALNARSLNRFEGTIQDVVLEAEAGSVVLTSDLDSGTMHIIPLEGGSSFWGADFLVAFLLDPEKSKYGWQLSPV